MYKILFLVDALVLFVQVFAYVIIAALTSYTKLSIVVQLHHNDSNDVALFVAGAVTQLGSLIGAILFLFLVYFTDLYTF